MSPFRIVTYGSALESTPESLFVMDRLRREEDARRAALDPIELEIVDVIEQFVEHAIFYGPTPNGGAIFRDARA